jgi:hypothetical protein
MNETTILEDLGRLETSPVTGKRLSKKRRYLKAMCHCGNIFVRIKSDFRNFPNCGCIEKKLKEDRLTNLTGNYTHSNHPLYTV